MPLSVLFLSSVPPSLLVLPSVSSSLLFYLSFPSCHLSVLGSSIPFPLPFPVPVSSFLVPESTGLHSDMQHICTYQYVIAMHTVHELPGGGEAAGGGGGGEGGS